MSPLSTLDIRPGKSSAFPIFPVPFYLAGINDRANIPEPFKPDGYLTKETAILFPKPFIHIIVTRVKLDICPACLHDQGNLLYNCHALDICLVCLHDQGNLFDDCHAC